MRRLYQGIPAFGIPGNLCYNTIMEGMRYKGQVVSDVAKYSPAERAGIKRGDTLLSINGDSVIDLVDYEYWNAESVLTVALRRADGTLRVVRVKKDACEPLGLCFATTLMDNMRTCKNRCVFCFIDQMKPGVRTSLHVKDDDWRMSFIMGNYVSLTNVDERELTRMIARRVSPLYVSLHATAPEVRTRMMHNPCAGGVMRQLMRLRDAGLCFHLQIVLCPGLNDGDVLRETLRDVETLLPAARSLAIVPVGLTKYRERLYPLRPYTGEEARALLDEMEAVQARCLSAYGTRLHFLSDEWYLLAGRELPPYEAYEEFEQLENGVGLLRRFARAFTDALAEKSPLPSAAAFAAAGGVAAAPFMQSLLRALLPYNVTVECYAVQNDYFGGNVNVGGLVTGGDLIRQLTGKLNGRPLLLPRNMLRERADVFLDNVTLAEAEAALDTKIYPFYDGEDFIETVFERGNA